RIAADGIDRQLGRIGQHVDRRFARVLPAASRPAAAAGRRLAPAGRTARLRHAARPAAVELFDDPAQLDADPAARGLALIWQWRTTTTCIWPTTMRAYWNGKSPGFPA